jgi:hypothetical protein
MRYLTQEDEETYRDELWKYRVDYTKFPNTSRYYLDEDMGLVVAFVDTENFLVNWIMDLGSSLDGYDLGKQDSYLGGFHGT